MRYIEAVEDYEINSNEKTLFVAGGITGCGDWQSELVETLKDQDITILNPRRKKYPDHPRAEREQITWEHDAMSKAQAVSFWFPNETLCPITLYELGKISAGNKKLFVGVDPDYARKVDLEIQLKLIRSDVKIVYSLGDLTEQIVGWANA
jgi:hypothetical protein